MIQTANQPYELSASESLSEKQSQNLKALWMFIPTYTQYSQMCTTALRTAAAGTVSADIPRLCPLHRTGAPSKEQIN